MRILSDSHHAGLTNSLILLFEKRLGYEIRFPAGMAWYPDFWALQPFESTARQYLERETEGVRGISLEEFKNTKFDILLCSVPQHVPMWIKLKDLYQPEAKLILQVGNMWTFDNNFPIKNILASAMVYPYQNFHILQYHQEFDLNIFKYSPPTQTKKIYSFINCLNTVELYKEDWELFLKLEAMLPDWEFKSFGGQCRDGAIAPDEEVAKLMSEADYIFMCKNKGDGYGHNIFKAAAMGKPLIVRKRDYDEKLAEPLIDFDTSITVDNATVETVANIISESWNGELITPEDRGKNIYKKFKENVNFDREEIDVRAFLDNLL